MPTKPLTRILKEIEGKAMKYTPKVGWQRSGLESFNFYLRFLNSEGTLEAQIFSGNLSWAQVSPIEPSWQYPQSSRLPELLDFSKLS